MDERAADPRADCKPLAAPPAAAAAPAPGWPVLARIADVARSGEEHAATDAESAKPSYRVDAPHVYAPNLSPPLAKLPAKPPHRPGTQRPAANNASEADVPGDVPPKVRLPDNVPLPIRMTVDAWRLVHPHRELIQFTAMVALMAVGGMSVVLMRGERVQNVETPSAAVHRQAPTTADADHALSRETNTQSADVDRTLTPDTLPDSDTTSTAPTATGPLVPESQVLMAVELPNKRGESERPSEPIYPTTSYPETKLPLLVDNDLPRVRTSEPAVAELRGIVQEKTTR